MERFLHNSKQNILSSSSISVAKTNISNINPNLVICRPQNQIITSAILQLKPIKLRYSLHIASIKKNPQRLQDTIATVTNWILHMIQTSQKNPTITRTKRTLQNPDENSYNYTLKYVCENLHNSFKYVFIWKFNQHRAMVIITQLQNHRSKSYSLDDLFNKKSSRFNFIIFTLIAKFALIEKGPQLHLHGYSNAMCKFT